MWLKMYGACKFGTEMSSVFTSKNVKTKNTISDG